MNLLAVFVPLLCLNLAGATEITEHDVDLVEAVQPQLIVVEVGQVHQTVKFVQAYGQEAVSLALQPAVEPIEGFMVLECVDCEPKQEVLEEDAEKSKEEPEREERLPDDLLHKKSEILLAEKMIEWYQKNPETEFQRQCFAENLGEGESIDFVIDLAPSPAKDSVDNKLAMSPLGIGLEEIRRDPSRAYFGSIEDFVEAVTLDVKPSSSHLVFFHNGRKFYVRGRGLEDSFPWGDAPREFKDEERNLVTLWPSKTKMLSESCLRSIVKNNLGHLTKMLLINRNNGLPIVASENRRSKSVYTIVISDGASGASIHQLTDDLSRTTVIDVGDRRFLKSMSWTEQRQLGGHFFSVSAPQLLLSLIDTCRFMACRFASNKEE